MNNIDLLNKILKYLRIFKEYFLKYFNIAKKHTVRCYGIIKAWLLKDKKRAIAAGAFAAAIIVCIIILAAVSASRRRLESLPLISSSLIYDEKTSERLADDGENVTILCAGDNLIHTSLYENAWNGETFDFSQYYSHVKDLVSAADIATVNQETPMASDYYDLSGYPRFNVPKEIGQTLIDTGFDIINLGNNHVYDMGSDGAVITKEYFDERDFPTVGLYDTYEDMFDIRVIEKNGIRVAFLSFVEFTNEEPDGGNGDIVWLADKKTIRLEIEAAKEVSDIIVAHVHWGKEGTTELTDIQTENAQFLVDEGVDVIFGNHPHWLQELTVLERSSDGTKCPVIYSLGNFVSGMDRPEELITGLFTVKVRRDPASGEVHPSEMEFTPLVTHFTEPGKTDLVVLPLTEYTDEMASQNYVNELRDIDFTIDYINKTVSDSIPKECIYQMMPVSEF